MYSAPAPPVQLVWFLPDHFWLCPIPFVLEYPIQPDHSKSGGVGPGIISLTGIVAINIRLLS